MPSAWHMQPPAGTAAAISLLKAHPVLSAILFLLVVKIVRSLHRSARNAYRARRLGCLPPPAEPYRLPFGLDIVARSLRADREQRTPDYVTSRFRALGENVYTFRVSLLGSTNLVTADGDNIRALLVTQFADFGMGAARTTNLKLALGRSIFASDGPAWKSAREVMRPLFARGNISRLDLLERHTLKLFAIIEKSVGADGCTTGPVSLAELIPSLTLDSSTELFLGSGSNILDAILHGESESSEHGHDLPSHHPGLAFQHAFERMLSLLSLRMRLRGLYFLYGSRQLASCVRTLHAFVDRAIASAGSTSPATASGQGGGSQYDFLAALRERCGGDDSETREQVLGLLAAGRDTTSSLLGWALYRLVRDRRVQDRLRREVLEALGPEPTETLAAPRPRPRDMTFETLKRCTYLQHVLSETLRMHPPVPFNSRRALRDTTLPVGGGPDGRSPVFVPAGMEVNFSPHVLQRRRDLWGADADAFVPERWEKSSSSSKKSQQAGEVADTVIASTPSSAWSFVPFGGGPRLCLGQQLALTEAAYVLARMMQRYSDIEGLDLDPTRDWTNFTVVSAPGSPLDREKAVLCRLTVARRGS